MGFLGTLFKVNLLVSFALVTLVAAYVAFICFVPLPVPGPERYASGSKLDLSGLTFSHVKTNRGVGLNVVTAGPQDGKLVIFLHGFPETALLSWHHQLHHFGEQDNYFVVAPDQRGYNTSDKPAGVENYRLNELAADVVSLIDYYQKDSAIVVGHDWGAAVAWWTAITHPTRVSKLAILNVPHPAAMERYLFTHLSQVRKSWYIFFFQLPFLPEFRFARDDFAWPWTGMGTAAPGTFGSDDRALYLQAWSEPGAIENSINWYRAALRFKIAEEGQTTRSVIREGTKISSPVLILWGKNDAFLESEMAQISLEYCKDGKLHFFESSHWLQHERPEEINKHLEEFFAKKV